MRLGGTDQAQHPLHIACVAPLRHRGKKRATETMPAVAPRSKLFHAIVVVGLSTAATGCGGSGQVATGSRLRPCGQPGQGWGVLALVRLMPRAPLSLDIDPTIAHLDPEIRLFVATTAARRSELELRGAAAFNHGPGGTVPMDPHAPCEHPRLQ
jgi:hypothetical protein